MHVVRTLVMHVVRTFRSACGDTDVDGSHAADLDLARRCAAGEPAAWDEFVREYRPVLYRAADALDPNGGARDLADALYADLYGVRTTGPERRSLLLTFNGRSSLASWLRAVLCQRYIDRLRAERRLEPLPADDPADVRQPADPNRLRYVELVGQALGRAVGRLATKDRLRLAYYYSSGADAGGNRTIGRRARSDRLAPARANAPGGSRCGRTRAARGRRTDRS